MSISKITKKTLDKMEKDITGVKLTLGKLIWSIRHSEECSQVDFARKLNISKQQLCDIEHDRKSISPKMAENYAKLLGYSEEQFIRLSLQAIVDRDGIEVDIEIRPKKHSGHTGFSSIVFA
jgi:transcriptional regulator with XRE-family HTH domain